MLDFLWMSHRHDVVRPAALVAKDEEEAARIHGDGDLLENVEKARTDQLMKLARELEALKARKAREFDLLEFAVALGEEELSHFEPVSRWHSDPVTPGQRDCLIRSGIGLAGIRNKGHASAVINKLSARRADGLATFRQVRALRRFGVEKAHLVTFHAASRMLDDFLRRPRTRSAAK